VETPQEGFVYVVWALVIGAIVLIYISQRILLSKHPLQKFYHRHTRILVPRGSSRGTDRCRTAR
jgi:hypothetical protein